LAFVPYKERVFEAFQIPLNAGTRYCAVLGQPVKHSASPAMQNAGMAALGLDWRYLAFEVRPEDLRAAIEGAKAMRFIGLNLTVPHKLAAMELVDALDESATKWGAVNTIRFEARDAQGRWQPLQYFSGALPDEVRSLGFNTDANAIVDALRDDLEMNVAGARILLLGAGGAGRVAALRLAAELPSEMFLVNRTTEKAEEVAGEIRQKFPQVKTSTNFPNDKVDLLVNATSVGLKRGDGLPLNEEQFPLQRAAAVYDMIYRPAETTLLKVAKAAGCQTANGTGMLLHQGARALELWTGRTAPVEIMRDALVKNVYGD
jgi:shikimate dehydrogenase